MSTNRILSDWLVSYTKYTENQESPKIFHLWCGFSILASALNRKCWSNRGYFFIYPNCYIVLVSNSALCKKTTAANIAIGVYNDVFVGTPAIAKKITLQKLLINMEKTCKVLGTSSCFLFNDELSVLIGRGGDSELMDFITGTYHCNAIWTNETKGQGVDTLKNIFVNFLAGTTPKDLASFPSTMIDGGFAGRTIFVYSDKPRPPIHNPAALFTDETIQLRLGLVEDLKQIANIHGEYIMTPEADSIYKEVYDSNYMRKDFDHRLAPYQGRKGDHIIKLAMILAASHRNETIIEPNDIKLANVLLSQTEAGMVDTYANVGYSNTSSSKHAEKFLKLLRDNNGEIDHSYALKRLYHYINADEMATMIKTLEESGVIKMYINGLKRRYTLITHKGDEK